MLNFKQAECIRAPAWYNENSRIRPHGQSDFIATILRKLVKSNLWKPWWLSPSEVFRIKSQATLDPYFFRGLQWPHQTIKGWAMDRSRESDAFHAHSSMMFGKTPRWQIPARCHEITQISKLWREICWAGLRARWNSFCRSIRRGHRLCCRIFTQGHGKPHLWPAGRRQAEPEFQKLIGTLPLRVFCTAGLRKA